MSTRKCGIAGCGRRNYGHGLCSRHYTRKIRNGSPDVSARPTFGMTAEQSFRHYMPEHPPSEGCWIWRGPVSNEYGSYKADNGRTYKAHRVSYALHNGPIPQGRLIRHTCDTPLCVQPAHLLPGTDADNNRDMLERKRNRQPKGTAQRSAKLNDETVREIRALYAAGGVTQQQLADRYGVHQTRISALVRGERWKHVT